VKREDQNLISHTCRCNIINSTVINKTPFIVNRRNYYISFNYYPFFRLQTQYNSKEYRAGEIPGGRWSDWSRDKGHPFVQRVQSHIFIYV